MFCTHRNLNTYYDFIGYFGRYRALMQKYSYQIREEDMGTELQREAVGQWYGERDTRLGRGRRKGLVCGH